MQKAMEMQEKADKEQADGHDTSTSNAAENTSANHTKSSKSVHIVDDEELPSNTPVTTDASVPIRSMERLQITAGEEAQMEAAGMSAAEKDLRKTEKRKGGLTKEQRAELQGNKSLRLVVMLMNSI